MLSNIYYLSKWLYVEVNSFNFENRIADIYDKTARFLKRYCGGT